MGLLPPRRIEVIADSIPTGLSGVRTLLPRPSAPQRHSTSRAAKKRIGRGRLETQSDRAALSAFQAAPRKTIIAENSIHTIKPIAAATAP